MKSKEVAQLLKKVLSSDIDWDAHYWVERTIKFLDNEDFDFDNLKIKQIQSKPEFLKSDENPSIATTTRVVSPSPAVSTIVSNSWLTF